MKESLWQFLASLDQTSEVQILIALMLSGLVGMAANWLFKYAKGEVGCFVDYVFRSNARHSLLAVLTYAGTALTAVMSGVFFSDTSALGELAQCAAELPEKTFVGWFNVLWMGATTGFGIDAVVNKGERVAWTPEQRVAKSGA